MTALKSQIIRFNSIHCVCAQEVVTASRGETVVLPCSSPFEYSYKVNFKWSKAGERVPCTYYIEKNKTDSSNCESRFKVNPEPFGLTITDVRSSDAGVYNCSITKTRVQNKLFVSCVRGSNGVSAILCASEGFYPAAVEQAWIRDGEFITYLNISNTFTHTNINPDGTHSLSLYLHLPTLTPEQVIYSCWVNHSSLSQPITVNISSTECSEKEDVWTGMSLSGSLVKVICIFCILLGCCSWLPSCSNNKCLIGDKSEVLAPDLVMSDGLKHRVPEVFY
uniref:Ig-like domain-containing protein n=1 Tax=Astyanax mexicanus TaxID=7994 RepID=A0A3B1IYS8_ASTMX